MIKRPDLSFRGSLTGRQWNTVTAIEARGDYVLIRRDVLTGLVACHPEGVCGYLAEARRDLARRDRLNEGTDDG